MSNQLGLLRRVLYLMVMTIGLNSVHQAYGAIIWSTNIESGQGFGISQTVDGLNVMFGAGVGEIQSIFLYLTI